MAVRKRKKIGNKGQPTSSTAKARKGKHLRINQCHDFAWSRSLWKDAATQIGRVCFVLVIAYLICATSLAASDGLGVIDMFYFISATTTTIGLGDISPSNQVNRAAAIILLPFGLVIISFGISVIIALAYARPFKAEEEEDLKDVVYDKEKGWITFFLEEIEMAYEIFIGTMAYRLVVMFLKYVAVLLIGVVFISINERERRLQENVGEDMSLVDNAYFATVLATTVGYGHLIVPQTDSLKLFLTFYMYLSTFVAGSIIGDISTLYIESKEDAIINIMVSSTTWVHKADLFKIGKICESDYVLFKLQQLQMVDDVVRQRLTNRFTELDFERRNRLLMIGRDVPSAVQVEKMKEKTKNTGKTLIRAWSEMRCELVADHFASMIEHGDDPNGLSCVNGRYVSVEGIEGIEEGNENEDEDDSNNGHNMIKEKNLSEESETKSDEGDKVPLTLKTKQMNSKNKTSKKKGGGAPSEEIKDDEEEDIDVDDDEDDDYGGGGGAPSEEVKDNDYELSNTIDTTSSGSILELSPRGRKTKKKDYFTSSFKEETTSIFDDIEQIEAKQQVSYGDMLKDHKSRPVRLCDCHDFAWSRQLWREAAFDTFKVASFLTVIYTILGWYLLVRPEEMNFIWGCYYLSATLSTVGFGDVAPTKHSTRLAAIFLIPFGLIIIGFLLSFVTAYTKSLPVRNDDGYEDPKILERRALFETLDADGDCVLTREEVIAGANLMSLSSQEAAELFDIMDTKKEGKLYPFPPKKVPFRRTAFGKLFILFLKLFITVSVGAFFFKFYKPEDDALKLTWIDAFYFATVTSTSVGYGDITPQTTGGRIFMIFYMLISTVIVGGVLSEVIDIYVNDYEGERIIQTIINSTTWVHSADIGKIGVITEADYVLFKLQQMQKVDANMLDLLIDRFEELDENANGWLDIGIDVPSAAQVKHMQEELENDKKKKGGSSASSKNKKMGSKNLIELWKLKQSKMESVLQARKTGDAIRQSRTLVEPDALFLDKFSIEKQLIDIRKSHESIPSNQVPSGGSVGGGNIEIGRGSDVKKHHLNKEDKDDDDDETSSIYQTIIDGVDEVVHKIRDYTTKIGTSLDDVSVSTDPKRNSEGSSETTFSRTLSTDSFDKPITVMNKKTDMTIITNDDDGDGGNHTFTNKNVRNKQYEQINTSPNENENGVGRESPSSPSKFGVSSNTSQTSSVGTTSSVANSTTAGLYAARYDSGAVEQEMNITSGLTSQSNSRSPSRANSHVEDGTENEPLSSIASSPSPSLQSPSKPSASPIEDRGGTKASNSRKQPIKKKSPRVVKSTNASNSSNTSRPRSNSAAVKKPTTENVEMV